MSLSTLLRAAAGRRFCGSKPETVARPLPDFERLALPKVGAAGMYFESLANHVPSYAPLDQSSTGSCVAQTWCLGEVVTLSARYGIQSPLPSRRAAYYWARLLAGGSITDDGCRPSDVLRAVGKYGIPPESSFDWSVARINQRPPVSARWDAMDHVGRRDSYQVYYGGLSDRIDALQSAVDSRRAFLITLPVGDTFDAARGAGTIEWPKASTIRGYHAVLGLGCSSSGVVEIINSWGRGWGSNGVGWLAPEYLERTSSLIVIDPQRAVQ